MRVALLFLALAVPAAAQQADAGVPQDLEKELEKAIQADTSAAAQQGQKGPPAPAPAVTSSTGGAPQTLFRGAQSLNPDMSAILDADFGWQRRAPQLLSGDDTDLHAELNTGRAGLHLFQGGDQGFGKSFDRVGHFFEWGDAKSYTLFPTKRGRLNADTGAIVE